MRFLRCFRNSFLTLSSAIDSGTESTSCLFLRSTLLRVLALLPYKASPCSFWTRFSMRRLSLCICWRCPTGPVSLLTEETLLTPGLRSPGVCSLLWQVWFCLLYCLIRERSRIFITRSMQTSPSTWYISYLLFCSDAVYSSSSWRCFCIFSSSAFSAALLALLCEIDCCLDYLSLFCIASSYSCRLLDWSRSS